MNKKAKSRINLTLLKTIEELFTPFESNIKFNSSGNVKVIKPSKKKGIRNSPKVKNIRA